MPNGANSRLTRWGGKTYSYDPNGNLLADGTHSYQWNERNQLTGLSAGATSLASFSYDSLGRRSAKSVAGATTGFVYDGDIFVQELLGASSNSAVKAQLLTGGIDETFLRIEGASRHSVLADGNNNTVRLLDANQTKVVDYTYEPYGRTTADATNGNTQQYTGRENDNPGNAGGLYYYRARYYMPGCARFISEDPIGWASGQTNNYSYVGGNPISLTDPTGLEPPGGALAFRDYMKSIWPSPGFGNQAAGATQDFLRNYSDMRAANTIGADKYFHCKANCEATQRGWVGEKTACVISDTREAVDQYLKMDRASASQADQVANMAGRSGAASGRACEAVCSAFRPRGL